jgi:hypothetical protein
MTLSATLTDQNSNPVSGAAGLVPTWDATLQLLVVTILGTATAGLTVGTGYTLTITGTGSYSGRIIEVIPCAIVVRGSS